MARTRPVQPTLDHPIPRSYNLAMLLARLGGWVLRHLSRQPWFWAWGGVAAGLWTLLVTFGPLGVTVRGGIGLSLTYEIAFLSLLWGNALGLEVLTRQAWLLSPLGVGRRVVVEWIVLGVAGLSCLVVGLLPAAWASGASISELALVAPAVLESQLHISVAASLILRIPARGLSPALMLPLAVWIAPALLETGGGLGARLAWLLSAQRPLSPGDWSFESWGGAALDTRPVVLLLLLLAALPTRRSVLHALRHPG